jgi:hypothetical protein
MPRRRTEQPQGDIPEHVRRAMENLQRGVPRIPVELPQEEPEEKRRTHLRGLSNAVRKEMRRMEEIREQNRRIDDTRQAESAKRSTHDMPQGDYPRDDLDQFLSREVPDTDPFGERRHRPLLHDYSPGDYGDNTAGRFFDEIGYAIGSSVNVVLVTGARLLEAVGYISVTVLVASSIAATDGRAMAIIPEPLQPVAYKIGSPISSMVSTAVINIAGQPERKVETQSGAGGVRFNTYGGDSSDDDSSPVEVGTP